MTATTQEAQEQEEQKFVTISHDKELDLLTVQFSQDIIIADNLFQEVAAFLTIYDQDSDYRAIITRKEFIEFIKKESILPILTRAVEELQLEFIQYAWNYILRVVDQELGTIYQKIKELMEQNKLTSEQEQLQLQMLESKTNLVIKRKCLWEIGTYTVDRANEYVQEQKRQQSGGEQE